MVFRSTTALFNIISPSSFNNPHNPLIRVVLPAPDNPIIAVNFSARMDPDTWSSTVRAFAEKNKSEKFISMDKKWTMRRIGKKPLVKLNRVESEPKDLFFVPKLNLTEIPSTEIPKIEKQIPQKKIPIRKRERYLGLVSKKNLNSPQIEFSKQGTKAFMTQEEVMAKFQDLELFLDQYKLDEEVTEKTLAATVVSELSPTLETGSSGQIHVQPEKDAPEELLMFIEKMGITLDFSFNANWPTQLPMPVQMVAAAAKNQLAQKLKRKPIKK